MKVTKEKNARVLDGMLRRGLDRHLYFHLIRAAMNLLGKPYATHETDTLETFLAAEKVSKEASELKTEKDLHKYMRKECKKLSIGFYKLHCEGQTGFPDLMLVYDGWIVIVELKSPSKTGRLSERQKYMISKLRNLGAEVYVIDSKEGADTLIRDLTGRGSE